jgi:hypothetical protein
MVSDSDGKNFPWYGNKTEVVEITGPQAACSLHHVSMNDNFHPHITWDTPVSDLNLCRLTRVKRHQKFLTWLVAMDSMNDDFIVLSTFKWVMRIEIEVDPTRELGERARVVGEELQEQPYPVQSNVRIPSCALYPTSANSSQVLVWYPRSRESLRQVVLGPKKFRPEHKNSGSSDSSY